MIFQWMCKLCEAESCMHEVSNNPTYFSLKIGDDHFLCKTCYGEVLESKKTNEEKLEFKEAYLKGVFSEKSQKGISFSLDLVCNDCNMSYGGVYRMYNISDRIVCEDCIVEYETPSERDFLFKEER